MLKFIPQFSCWKIGPDDTIVIASCAKTHEVRLFHVNTAAMVECLPGDCVFPDLRSLVPCRWHALTACQRASVRDHFHSILRSLYGEEELAGRYFGTEL